MRFRSFSEWSKHVKKNRANYMFISLAVLGVIFFRIGPLFASLYFSFTKYDILTAPKFRGLYNFVKLTRDPLFIKALFNSFYYMGVGLPLRLLVALVAAMLLNQKIRGVGIFRTMYYLPAVTAGVAISLLWRFIYQPEYGLMNTLLSYIGIKGPGWLGSTVWAMPAIIIMMSFNIGRFMLIFLGGLQNIPDQLYEAIELDGGKARHKFLHVTLPYLTPVLFFNLIIGMIDMMQSFTQPYVMTRGGPADATLVYVLYIYQTAFQNLKMGYASALSWVLFVILLLLTWGQFKLSGKWVFYRGEKEGGRNA